ncbi:MAG: tetratricopeptide repeat protein [Lachnospiraceae bacterium]
MSQKLKLRLLGILLIIFMMNLLTGCVTKEDRQKEAEYRESGIAAMETGNYSEAISDFNLALDQVRGMIGADELDICYYKAAAQFASGDIYGAIDTYDILVEYDEKNAQNYFLRGGAYLAVGEMQKATDDYDQAVALTDDLAMYLAIADNLSDYSYSAQADTYLTMGLEESPRDKASNYRLQGEMYTLLGDTDSALTSYMTALEKGDVDVNLNLAQYYVDQGDPDQAKTYIDTYVAAYPESSVALNAQGMEKMNAADYQGAITDFNQALALDMVTNEQELRRNLIAAYEKAGDFVTAKAMMETYINDYPDDADAQREWMFLQSR